MQASYRKEIKQFLSFAMVLVLTATGRRGNRMLVAICYRIVGHFKYAAKEVEAMETQTPTFEIGVLFFGFTPKDG